MRYLGYRPRSETEIRDYLRRRGHSREVAEQVLEKLRSLRYIDDESFARNWAMSKTRNRAYGPDRIARELRAKGIAAELIRQILRDIFGRCDEKTQAQRLLAKRFGGEDLRDLKTLRRAAAFLQRRGYSNAVISELLRNPDGEE